MEVRPIRLDEYILGFLEETVPDSRARGLEITADHLAPVTVSADPGQLHRVLANIVENSVKYRDKDTGHLRITLEESGRLILADDGPGCRRRPCPSCLTPFTAVIPPGRTPPAAAAWDWPSPPRRCRAWAAPSVPSTVPAEGWLLTSPLRRRAAGMQKIPRIRDDGDIAAA